jgi:pyruvate dehydrogenase E2 component (dihydrolipoamide acetyltransferase)
MSEPTDLVTPPSDVTVAEGTKRGTATSRIPTRVQTAIARRMAEVRATVPTWTATIEADVEELTVALTGDVRLVDAVARATGIALVEHERVNGAWRDGRLETWTQANIALAIDLDGASIVLPTLPNADAQPLAGLAARRRSVTEKAREGTLRAPDRFDAIMPPGTGACLALGAPRRAPWVVGDQVVPRHVVALTLTADHRVVYPAPGGAFLRRVADLLEDPTTILRD